MGRATSPLGGGHGRACLTSVYKKDEDKCMDSTLWEVGMGAACLTSVYEKDKDKCMDSTLWEVGMGSSLFYQQSFNFAGKILLNIWRCVPYAVKFINL